jgi:hypothetical protein
MYILMGERGEIKGQNDNSHREINLTLAMESALPSALLSAILEDVGGIW